MFLQVRCKMCYPAWGAIKDDEVIEAADEHGLIMIFTGIRHFKH